MGGHALVTSDGGTSEHGESRLQRQRKQRRSHVKSSSERIKSDESLLSSPFIGRNLVSPANPSPTSGPANPRPSKVGTWEVGLWVKSADDDGAGGEEET